MLLHRQQRLPRAQPQIHILVVVGLGKSAVGDIALRILTDGGEGQGVRWVVADGRWGGGGGDGTALLVTEVGFLPLRVENLWV